jgi:hypothetical protein
VKNKKSIKYEVLAAIFKKNITNNTRRSSRKDVYVISRRGEKNVDRKKG